MARTAAARVSDTEAVVRIAQLRVVCGRRATVAEQRAIAATVALEVTGLALPEARSHVRPREWVIAALHAAGWTYERIADAFGYSQRSAVRRVVLRPAVQDLLQRVRECQLAEIIAGTYGVRAAAKAAAPRVVEHVCELAGASRAPDGTRKNRAHRDRDALRAGALVLGLAGDLVERPTTVHGQPWLEAFSDTELEAYCVRGVVPARLAALPGPVPYTACAVSPDAMVHAELGSAGAEPALAGGATGRGARARTRSRPAGIR